MTIKVLHLIDSGGLYGAEMVLLNLVEEQIKAGLNPLILSAGTPDIDEKPLEKAALERGVPIKKWRMKAGFNLPEAWKILKFAKREGVQILHSHGYKFNLLMGVWPRAVRAISLVTTIHGYVNSPKYTRMWLYEALDRLILPRLDAVVVVNTAMANNSVLSRMPAEKVHLIENGISCDIWPLSLEIEGEVERNFISMHQPLIGGVGRLSPEKGFHTLIEAFALIRQKYPKAGLLIIGEGGERVRLAEIVRSHDLGDSVLMAGYKSDSLLYMSKMDCLVMPSLTEGLPMTLLEALWIGTPIVASAVGGIPYVLRNGRPCGWLISPNDKKAIFASVDEVLSNPDDAKQRIEAGKERISVDYTSRVMGKKYQSLYCRLMGIEGERVVI